MTINEIRQKLGRIVEPLFSYEEYQRRYTMIVSQMDEASMAALLVTYADDIDSFVALYGEHVGDARMIRCIVKSANPLVLAGFFMRYHMITQHLIAMEQTQERPAPRYKREFLTEVFVDLWGEINV